MAVTKSVASVDVLLQLQKPDGNFVDIGGQQGAFLNRETVTRDISVKANLGRTEFMILSDTWDIECNGFLKINDDGIELLHDAIFNRKYLKVKVTFSDGFTMEGDVLVKSFPVAVPNKGTVTYTLSLVGSGELRKVNL